MPRLSKADPTAKKIGRRICELRESAGLTREKLAYEAGFKSKSHISGLEKGLVRPTLPSLEMLAERLGVEVFDLLTFPEDSPRHELVALSLTMKPGTIRKLLADIKKGRRAK